MTTVAVVLAAGAGRRVGGAEPKQYRDLAGRPVVRHSVDAFGRHPGIDAVWLVGPSDDLDRVTELAGDAVDRVLAGGASRTASVASAIAALDEGVERVLVHDAARPGLPPEVIDRVVAALDDADVVATVVPVDDTVVVVRDGRLVDTPDRATLFAHQTPQGFAAWALREAHAGDTAGFTDDVTLVTARVPGVRVATVRGDVRLRKVTYEHDLRVVAALLA